MGLIFNILLIIIQLAKTLCPFMALIFMICWGFLIGNPELFAKCNEYLGFFPDFLNEVFKFKQDIDGQDVDMGYVLAAAFSFVLMFILIQLQNFVEFHMLLYRERVIEQTKEDLRIQKIISKMDAKKEEFVELGSFWALFEFDFAKSDIYFDDIDIEKLKKQYLKTIFSKLSEKYKNIKIAKDKLCFEFSNFGEFKNSIYDIANFLKTLREIALKKGLKFDYILSYFSSGDSVQNKNAFSILSKINNLKMKNKIVVSKDIKDYCFKKGVFHFLALGSSILFAQNNSEKDLTLELFQIQSFE